MSILQLNFPFCSRITYKLKEKKVIKTIIPKFHKDRWGLNRLLGRLKIWLQWHFYYFIYYLFIFCIGTCFKKRSWFDNFVLQPTSSISVYLWCCLTKCSRNKPQTMRSGIETQATAPRSKKKGHGFFLSLILNQFFTIIITNIMTGIRYRPDLIRNTKNPAFSPGSPTSSFPQRQGLPHFHSFSTIDIAPTGSPGWINITRIADLPTAVYSTKIFPQINDYGHPPVGIWINSLHSF